MNDPYRHAALPVVERRRSLDPWMLSLLFAWVCDLGRIGVGFVNQRPIEGELGFGVFLTLISIVVAVVRFRQRGR